jgi:uncharacterized protein YdhG (YjbR/CyaY superfamily)
MARTTRRDVMPGPATVDEYIAGFPEDRRVRLQQLRAVLRAGAPDAVEAIAYQMPALRLDGRFLVSYAAFRRHDSLFPASAGVVAELGADVAPYLAGKGTIRFPLTAPIPVDLVERIVRVRLVEHASHRGAP